MVDGCGRLRPAALTGRIFRVYDRVMVLPHNVLPPQKLDWRLGWLSSSESAMAAAFGWLVCSLVSVQPNADQLLTVEGPERQP